MTAVRAFPHLLASPANGDVLEYEIASLVFKNVKGGRIPNGTTFPASPATGQLFFFTTWSSLFEWNGTTWTNLIAYAAIQMYVDIALGADTIGKGTGTGANAVQTLAYALSLLPLTYGGNVTIRMAAGTYTETLTNVPARNTRGFSTFIEGTITQVATGTITTGYPFPFAPVVRTGSVQTTGTSVTVDVIGGGNTTGMVVGDVVIANSLQRYVTAINSSTQFTIDLATDFIAGYAWSLNQISTIEDTAATWTDDLYNNRLFTVNLADPYVLVAPTNQLGAGGTYGFIKDTLATAKQLQLGVAVNTLTTGHTYRIYTLDTIINVTGNWNIFLEGVVFRFIQFNHGASSTRRIDMWNVTTGYVGCDFTNQRNVLRAYGARLQLGGCMFRGGTGTGNILELGRAAGDGLHSIQQCFFVSQTTTQTMIVLSNAQISFLNCYVDYNGTSNSFLINANTFSVVSFFSNLIRKVGGTKTVMLTLSTNSLGISITSLTMTPNFAVPPYTITAAQNCFVT